MCDWHEFPGHIIVEHEHSRPKSIALLDFAPSCCAPDKRRPCNFGQASTPKPVAMLPICLAIRYPRERRIMIIQITSPEVEDIIQQGLAEPNSPSDVRWARSPHHGICLAQMALNG